MTGRAPELSTRYMDRFPPVADHIESLGAQAQHLESHLQMTVPYIGLLMSDAFILGATWFTQLDSME